MVNIAPNRLMIVPVREYLCGVAQLKLLHDSKSLLDAHTHIQLDTQGQTYTQGQTHTGANTHTGTNTHTHTQLIGVSLLLTLATTV